MSAPDPDELAGTEQPFVSHLIELRDRLIRAAIAVGVCAAVLFFYPGPAALYDLLAAPLVAHLPAGGTLIATNVISPFLVPMKITLMTAFLCACRSFSIRPGPSSRRASTCTRRSSCCRW